MWLSWKDIRNPISGGAEVFAYEVAKRLVQKGNDVTLFTSRFLNSFEEEIINEIRVVRRGGKYSVYGNAKKFYKQFEGQFDIVVDEINTRPFMTPKFVKNKPVLALIHQLAREFWFYETRFPINYIGYHYLEKKWLSNYTTVPTITVSNSTKRDLEKLGFTRVSVVPEGVSATPLSVVPDKESEPTVIFLGRLKKAKLPDHAVKAFTLIKQELPATKMWMVGDGIMLEEVKRLNIEGITFYGRAEDRLKYRLLSRAHVLLMPAVREGWGLVVTEANAMGTPAVAYSVPGLTDSIIDNKTGLLTRNNSPSGLAASASYLLKNKSILQQYSDNALAFAKSLNWSRTASAFNDKIEETAYGNNST